MFKPAHKSKRNIEEACFLCFYRQPWTSHCPVEKSWVKQVKTIKMMLKYLLVLCQGNKIKTIATPLKLLNQCSMMVSAT